MERYRHISGGQPVYNKAEMARLAVKKLGLKASTGDIQEYVKERWGAVILQSTVSIAKKAVREEQGESLVDNEDTTETNGVVQHTTRVEVEESDPVVKGRVVFTADLDMDQRPVTLGAIRLTRQAIEAAGGKDNLKELIDLL